MKTRRQLFRKITITGKIEEYEKAVKYCKDNGYHETYSGPKRTSAIDVDVSRFKIIAEKEIFPIEERKTVISE